MNLHQFQDYFSPQVHELISYWKQNACTKRSFFVRYEALVDILPTSYMLPAEPNVCYSPSDFQQNSMRHPEG